MQEKHIYEYMYIYVYMYMYILSTFLYLHMYMYMFTQLSIQASDPWTSVLNLLALISSTTCPAPHVHIYPFSIRS